MISKNSEFFLKKKKKISNFSLPLDFLGFFYRFDNNPFLI